MKKGANSTWRHNSARGRVKAALTTIRQVQSLPTANPDTVGLAQEAESILSRLYEAMKTTRS